MSQAGHGRGGPLQGKVQPCPSRVGPCVWAFGGGTRIRTSGVQHTDWTQAEGGPRTQPDFPGRSAQLPAVPMVARTGGTTAEPGTGGAGQCSAGDQSLLITERQQKHCLAFSPKTIAGIASAVILFVAVVATTICCFLCSCCYLYRRRQQLQSPFEGQEIPMTGIPVQPVYPYPQDPKAGPAPPQPGFMYPPSGPAPQYPLYPAGPPVYNPAAPPPYMPPQPSHPGA
ncbi:protein shisa-4 isoform X1 [Sapajus apella]|uniref:Protein shisa-4 isoform X1 n=1 Tax=Sapajus apella TaxID=9515 RepID=A0A6J3IQ44_SAPAP|nr:protein shisa-4 isoform X1 [Sapajus apella]